MTDLHTTRRNFLKGAVGAAGLAALYGAGDQSSALRAVLPGVHPVQAQGEFPSNRMSAVLPDISNDINLVTPHLGKEIAPGLVYEVWAFNDSAPGPFLHVREGETVHFKMENTSTMDHSIDFHAAQIAWDKYYQAVKPGETLEFEFVPKYPGAFMYHCGTPPVLSHIGNGMHSGIIVEPAAGWAEPAREYVIVQHEWYLGETNEQGFVTGSSPKMSAGTPDLVVFNGYFNQYMDDPLVADPGELIRIHVVDCGPTLWSAFHVIGALFEAVYPDGNPANKQVGVQTISVPPGGGFTVELRIPDEGLYPFVTHSFAYTGKGALGVIKVGNPDVAAADGN